MKKFLFILAVVITALQVSAADVTTSQAQAAANAFLRKQVATGRLKASAASNLKLVKAEASVAKPASVDYYIFNSEKSYVVVAGDDLAPQILMYGEEGALDMDNVPPAMQWLLNKYKYQIDGLKAGTMVPIKQTRFATTPVAPLVTANWDQSAPYYNQCPTSGSRRTLTGCPATSMSMNYYRWKWPETFPAAAAISGSSSGGVSAAALPERAADWDNMIDEYTGPSNYSYNTTQANAVAWLMRYAGQLMPDYMYGTGASGANDPEIIQGVHNMGYTDAQYLMLTELVQSGWSYINSSQYYTDTQWNEFMVNELQNGRPIEYLAYDVSGYTVSGHAFNVFGVNASGQYYVNWGWSGDSNGYCTLHNFTTATGATGQSGSYVFNYGEAMIIGIEPPAGALTNPRITVNPAMLTMNTTVGTPVTETFTVTGYNLTSRVALSLSGDNAFSLSTTSISASQAENGVTVTVTYDPTLVGNQEATVTLTSTDAESVTVKLNGTAEPTPLVTYAPVMLEASNIHATSFTATWTDQTPAENVESYTLYVSAEPFKPEVALLDTTDWTASAALPTGWSQTGLTYYSSNSACYLSGSASNAHVQSATYDLTGYDKVTVMIYSEPYNSSNTLTVATSVDSETQSLPTGASFAWYTFVLDCATSDYVYITSSGMPDMRYVRVYAGDLSTRQIKASETGDATYRVITGLKDKSYTVNGLTEGGTFYFYVMANYVNGTAENSNTEEVTLLDSDLERYNPVMQPANEEYINLTEFRADWTDATPEENVVSYTLEVSPKPTEPEILEPVLLEDANFTNLAAAESSSGSLTNVVSSASNYLPTGWTAQTGLWVNDGFIISGNLNGTVCGITSKTYDFTGYDKVTVVMSAYSYYASYYGSAVITVKTSAGSQNVTLATDDFTTYNIVLDVAESDQVVFEGYENLFAIEDIKIYAGDKTAALNMFMASETGGPEYRLIEGITPDKFYTVKDLTAGGTFLYRVKALYIDGTESGWSNVEEVTLFENGHGYQVGDVNHSGTVDIADVTALIDYLLSSDSEICEICADMNGGGDVDIADVTALIDMLLSGDTASIKTPKINRNNKVLVL